MGLARFLMLFLCEVGFCCRRGKKRGGLVSVVSGPRCEMDSCVLLCVVSSSPFSRFLFFFSSRPVFYLLGHAYKVYRYDIGIAHPKLYTHYRDAWKMEMENGNGIDECRTLNTLEVSSFRC